jgi:hypothetical protein
MRNVRGGSSRGNDIASLLLLPISNMSSLRINAPRGMRLKG